MSCTCDEPERWRPIPGHPRYAASTHGRIRNQHTGRVLKPRAHSRGYVKVDLGRKATNRLVHRLVAAAFYGDRTGALDVDHIDWCKTHNCTGNLRWLSRRENACRYHHREGDRIVWNIRHELDDEALDGYEPMGDAETAEVLAALSANGWAS